MRGATMAWFERYRASALAPEAARESSRAPRTRTRSVQFANLTSRTRQRASRRIGELLDGKWRLDALLGSGGSAAVYAATHRNGKRAAIKILHPYCAADDELRARFLREGYVANKVDHPGALEVLDDDVAEDGTVYLVMELLTGTALESVGRGEAPPLGVAEVVRVTDMLLDVLAKAHSLGVVHRDIKPGNLFLTKAGDLKVLDFGIARLVEARGENANLTQTGLTMGTPGYMSPEQARARWDEVDARSDLWAVGATMLALLMGHRPRRAETANEELLLAMTKPLAPASSLVPSLPPALAAVIDRAVAFDRAERWPSATAMQAALREAAKELLAQPRARSVVAPAASRAPAAPPPAPPPLPRPAAGAPLTEGGAGAPEEARTLVHQSSPELPPLLRPPVDFGPQPDTTTGTVLHSTHAPLPTRRSGAAGVAVGVGLAAVILGAIALFVVPDRGGAKDQPSAPTVASPSPPTEELQVSDAPAPAVFDERPSSKAADARGEDAPAEPPRAAPTSLTPRAKPVATAPPAPQVKPTPTTKPPPPPATPPTQRRPPRSDSSDFFDSRH